MLEESDDRKFMSDLSKSINRYEVDWTARWHDGAVEGVEAER